MKNVSKQNRTEPIVKLYMTIKYWWLHETYFWKKEALWKMHQKHGQCLFYTSGATFLFNYYAFSKYVALRKLWFFYIPLNMLRNFNWLYFSFLFTLENTRRDLASRLPLSLRRCWLTLFAVWIAFNASPGSRFIRYSRCSVPLEKSSCLKAVR